MSILVVKLKKQRIKAFETKPNKKSDSIIIETK